MKLRRCYIENFGKLHNFEYEFQEGINTIKELNGWGKTTFAAFIKSMFYGLEYTTKRSVNENERKKYTPWQGGIFGGNLDFEIEGKVYRIERFFGLKDKEDTFILYDQLTQLESRDYTDKIGEEVFKINKEAYERSTYLPQDKLSVTINDSLNAKLSNLIENGDDINNYESAISTLEKKAKYYQKIGDKGRIAEIREELIVVNRLLERCSKEENAIIDWEKIREKKEIEKSGLELRLKEIKDKIIKASEYEGKAAKKQYYDLLCSNVSKDDFLLNEKIQFFKGFIPIEGEIDYILENINQINENKRKLKEVNITVMDKEYYIELKNIFANGIPEEKSLDDCQKYINEYQNNELKIKNYKLNDNENNRYIELKQFFNQYIPSEEDINLNYMKLNEINKLNEEISAQQSKILVLEDIRCLVTKDENKNKISPLIYLLVLVGMLSILVGFFSLKSYLMVGALGFVIGILLFVIFAFSLAKIKKQSNSNTQVVKEHIDKDENIRNLLHNLENNKKEIETDLYDFVKKFSINSIDIDIIKNLTEIKSKLNEYEILTIRFKEYKSKVEEIKSEQSDLINKINDILGNYYKILNENNFELVLSKIRTKRDDYVKLSNKIDIYNQSSKILDEVEPKVIEFFKNYFDILAKPYEELFDEIKDSQKEVNRLQIALKEHRKEKSNFENNYDVSKLNDLELIEDSLQDLQMEEKTIESHLSNLTEEINGPKGINSNIVELSKTVDSRPDYESDKERLEEELNFCVKKYDILEKTIKFLKNAKEQFSTHYLKNMSIGFDKYINMINGESLGNSNIDVKLNIKIEEYGAKRDADYYSKGVQDLIGICTRLALVDALFEHEKPFIILDDPFANLDDGKLNNALALINEVAKKYQIIYLVCHTSRI